MQMQMQEQQQQYQDVKSLRPDSELDSFRQEEKVPETPRDGSRTQEQYVNWLNRNLPDTVDPVSDMTQSLRSGVVLVRLIEQLSGEQVDKRIPNATYTLQMLENLLTAFKFMDRVGISTDGYTVKDIFNGNEDKIVKMFDSIQERFPESAVITPVSVATLLFNSIPAPPPGPAPSNNFISSLPPMPMGPAPTTPILGNKGSPRIPNGGNSPALSNGRPPLIGNGQLYGQQQQQLPSRMQTQHAGGSEFEALYDEAARSTIS